MQDLTHQSSSDHPTNSGTLDIASPQTRNATAMAAISELPNSPDSKNSGADASVNGSSCACGAGGSSAQMVYALGQLGYDFVSESRRNSLQQTFSPNRLVENPTDLLEHLNEKPWDAAGLQWILSVENTPVYVLQPTGPYAQDCYQLLRQFLREQLFEGVERVSIPGLLIGTTQIRSGYTVPILSPEIRGMFSWSTTMLIEKAMGAKRPEPQASREDQEKFEKSAQGVRGFLDRVYHGLRNTGQTPQERALNFAATSTFQVQTVFESAIVDKMELDTIQIERSPVGRPGADCWDVKLGFFYPEEMERRAKKVYRFTVDVTDVVPTVVGQLRSWSER